MKYSNLIGLSLLIMAGCFAYIAYSTKQTNDRKIKLIQYEIQKMKRMNEMQSFQIDTGFLIKGHIIHYTDSANTK